MGLGSYCWPPHLDEVDLSDDGVRVVASHGPEWGACISLGVPYLFVLAIESDSLPAAPFHVHAVIDGFDEDHVVKAADHDN
jgi:hypothetical protein